MNYKYSVLYIALIVFVNWLFTVVDLVDLPTGEKWPPASLVVGLIFVARDFAQREIGHRVIVAMLIAGVLSYYMASPYVAMASVTAFLISEFADWAIYSYTGRPFAQRVLISSIVATPIDSAVFLYMLGHLGILGVTLMTLSKLVGAVVVWAMIRNRLDNAPA